MYISSNCWTAWKDFFLVHNLTSHCLVNCKFQENTLWYSLIVFWVVYAIHLAKQDCPFTDKRFYYSQQWAWLGQCTIVNFSFSVSVRYVSLYSHINTYVLPWSFLVVIPSHFLCFNNIESASQKWISQSYWCGTM